MAGLVGYDSSDEDEDIEQPTIIAASSSAAAPIKGQNQDPGNVESENSTETQKEIDHDESAASKGKTEEEAVTIGPVQQNAVPLGPSLPPMDEPLGEEQADPGEAPLSPYSTNRALLRDLTLPSDPNMDIPPSPPGSPTPGANKKFEQFLELKKKGIHFNAKLEQSSALKNPSLMDKLLNFVEIDHRDQYSTTLPTDLWDPNGFPEWAFKDKLRKSREKLAKEKEAERTSGGRTNIDFVPSAATTGATGSAGPSRGDKRKSGWK